MTFLERAPAAAVFALLLVNAPIAVGQDSFDDYEVVGASYHKFVLPGEASISVTVLGSVGGTGIYEISRGSDIGRLFALSGPGFGEQLSGTKRTTKLRLFRPEGAARRVIYEASLEDFLAQNGAYPVLQDGDVFVVESQVKQKFGWRDGLSILTGITALSLAIDRLSN